MIKVKFISKYFSLIYPSSSSVLYSNFLFGSHCPCSI